MTTITATASCATPSTCTDRGVDVDVTVEIDGIETEGEVTLLPAADGRPCYESWGAGPDHWVSSDLLRALRALGEDDFRRALDEIAAAASAEAGSPADVEQRQYERDQLQFDRDAPDPRDAIDE